MKAFFLVDQHRILVRPDFFYSSLVHSLPPKTGLVPLHGNLDGLVWSFNANSETARISQLAC